MNGELPDGWASAKLGEIAIINPRHPQDVSDRIPVTFVRMSGVSALQPDFESTEERPLGAVRRGFTHFSEGDVLFAKITPCMENGKGAVARHLKNGLGCGTTELHVIRPQNGVDPYYIYRFLAQKSVRQDAKAHFTGTAGQARVPTSFIEELEIPLPPELEQQRITKALTDLLPTLALAQDRLAAIPVVLQRLRLSILASACSGRLTAAWRKQHRDVQPACEAIDGLLRSTGALQVRRGVPESVPESDLVAGWSLPRTWGVYSAAALLRSGAFVDIKDGNHGANHPKVSEFTKHGLPFITAAQVNGFEIDYDGAYRLSGRPLARIRVGLAEAGDVVYTHKGSVGRVAIVERPCILTPQTTYYRVSPEVFLNRYLMLYLASGSFSAQADVVKAQTTRDFVPISEQYSLFHRVPPLEEQKEIARLVDGAFELVDRIEALVGETRRRVENLTPSLLVKAFHGELVPTEAELAAAEGRAYETATELLERIRRSAGPVGRRKAKDSEQVEERIEA